MEKNFPFTRFPRQLFIIWHLMQRHVYTCARSGFLCAVISADLLWNLSKVIYTEVMADIEYFQKAVKGNFENFANISSLKLNAQLIPKKVVPTLIFNKN